MIRALSVSVQLVTQDGFFASEYVGNTTYRLEIRANYFAMGFIGFYLNIFHGAFLPLHFLTSPSP